MRLIKALITRIRIKLCNGPQYIDYLRKQGATIGKGCEIHKSVGFGEEGFMVTIGDNVRITSGVRLIPHDGGLWTLRKMGLLPDADYFAPIYIGDNTHIGNDAIIMPGVRIGKNNIIACGAVVTKSTPDGVIVGGIPARIIEPIETYYEKKKDLVDNTKHMSGAEKREYYENKYGLKGK